MMIAQGTVPCVRARNTKNKIAQGTVPCVRARNTKNTQNRPSCYVGIMGVWQPALSILIGGLTAAFTTTCVGLGISTITTLFLSAHNDKVNTYKTMILNTILNGNESDLYFELSSIILITTPLFGEIEKKELLSSIIFEKVEGLV